MKTKLILLLIVFLSIKGFAQIAEYSFDNTLNNSAGNTAFSSSAQLSFVEDRYGNAQRALLLNGNGATASIANLPIGGSARTISLWVKSTLSRADNWIFNYGSGSANSSCGLGQFTANSQTDLRFFGYSNDLSFFNPVIPTSWTHYVVTYSSAGMASIYVDGVLKINQTKAGWNTVNTVFRLGKDVFGVDKFIGSVDDLKIYDRELNAPEVTDLYNYYEEAKPTLSDITTQYSNQTTVVDYKINANGLNTTTVINYGLDANALTSQVAATNATGTVKTSQSVTFTNLTPGATYYFEIVATNSLGATSSVIQSFVNEMPPLVEYNFNNTLNNRNGTDPFTSHVSATFVADRNANPSSALRINGTFLSAPIANIPVGKAARTVSVWVKIPNASVDNHIFRYGRLSTNEAYGLAVQGSNLANFGYANDLYATGYTIAGADWVHVVTTFDGTTAKIYYNGVERGSENKSSWNTNPSYNFFLGGAFDFSIDDLKIYDRALNAVEISNLYNFGVITSSPPTALNSNYLTNLSIYPNPATDMIRFENGADNTIKEIYNLQGEKVMITTEKAVSIAHLPVGLYLVKLKTAGNIIATTKFMKK